MKTAHPSQRSACTIVMAAEDSIKTLQRIVAAVDAMPPAARLAVRARIIDAHGIVRDAERLAETIGQKIESGAA